MIVTPAVLDNESREYGAKSTQADQRDSVTSLRVRPCVAETVELAKPCALAMIPMVLGVLDKEARRRTTFCRGPRQCDAGGAGTDPEAPARPTNATASRRGGRHRRRRSASVGKSNHGSINVLNHGRSTPAHACDTKPKESPCARACWRGHHLARNDFRLKMIY